MFASWDVWTWTALAALPFWIAAFTAAFRFMVEWAGNSRSRLALPVYMGVGIPLLIIALATPVGMLTRQLDRSFEYDRCVVNENAFDTLNGCPDWAVKALRGQLPKRP